MAAQTGRDDCVLIQARSVLVWVPSETKAEIRLWVEVVYLGGDSWNDSGRREHESETEKEMKRDERKPALGGVSGVSTVGSWSSVLQEATHSPTTSCPPLVRGCP